MCKDQLGTGVGLAQLLSASRGKGSGDPAAAGKGPWACDSGILIAEFFSLSNSKSGVKER